jgi:hypothetical protein
MMVKIIGFVRCRAEINKPKNGPRYPPVARTNQATKKKTKAPKWQRRAVYSLIFMCSLVLTFASILAGTLTD